MSFFDAATEPFRPNEGQSMDVNLQRLLIGLDIPEDQMESSYNNLRDWANQVRHVESDNNPMASPESTSAKGVYQFTDDSVLTGKNRMRNMGYDEAFINAINENPQKWSDEQADAMFYGNVFAQAGSDSLLKEIAGGNLNARQNAYYKFHHTAPDEATKKRVQKLMPTLQDDVVQEQGSEAF